MKKTALLLTLILGFCQFLLWAQTEKPGTDNLVRIAPPDSLLLEPAQEDSLFYAADSISYNQSLERINLFGNTSVKYQEFTFSSDSLLIDLKTKRAYSNGDTVMQDGEQILLGTDVAYDLDTQTGIMNDGSSRMDKGFYSGDGIRKIGKDIYDIDNGSFTTCEYAEPDFWFTSKELRIYRGDKIVGKPVVAYVNHLPMFYFPFFTVPIRRGRHPGFLIPEPGYNNVDGKFLKDISWYYPYKDYADIILSLDLTERTGWKTKLSVDYINRYVLSGNFDAAYQKRISSAQTYYDWSLRANHHQELGDKSTFDLNLDFVSNKRVWDSSDLLDENLAQRVTSTVSFRKPLLNSSLNIGASYTQDLINDNVSISLPSATFSLPTRPVYELFYKPERSPDAWWSNLNYSYNIRFDHIGTINVPNRTFEDLIWNNYIDLADTTKFVQHNMGIKQHAGLSYNWKLRGWLAFQHGLSYDEAWFDRDKNNNKLVRGNDYSAYSNASFNIFGIRNYQKGWLRSVRHILTPTVGLSFNPDFSDNSRFYSFGGIGLSSAGKAANLSLSLYQKWAIKYGKTDKKINDLFTLNSSVSANLIKKIKPFGTLSHTVNFRPGTFALGTLLLPGTKLRLEGLSLGYSSQYTLSHDPYDLRWTDWKPANQYFSHSLTLSGNTKYKQYFSREKNRVFDPYENTDSLQIQAENLVGSADTNNWKISITHNLIGKDSILRPTSDNLRFDAALKITANWSLTYGNYYDLQTSQLLSQTIRVTRDLHCWKLDFSYTKRNEFWEYRVTLFNVSLPDALRFQTHDSKRY